MHSQEIIDSNDLIDVVWLTSGFRCVPAGSGDEVEFWKTARKASKFTHVSVRIVYELGFLTSDCVEIWRDRLNAEIISVSLEDIITRNGMTLLSTTHREKIFCCNVRWRVFVRCVSNPQFECESSHARMRVRLLDEIASGRYCKEFSFFLISPL